jgi:hypothetical protein
MYKLIFILFTLVGFTQIGFSQNETTSFFDSTRMFFQEHVKSGLVDYKAIKENQADLNRLIKRISAFEPPESAEPDYYKAFLINSFNLLAIYSVIEKYPVRSPKDIAGFFDKNKYLVANKTYTLDELEKTTLEKYNDPRLHFALVCAALGCPNLISTAYLPERLEQQLEKQTVSTLNNEYYLNIDRIKQRIQVSEIFKWYEKDFLSQNENIIEYINSFVDENIPYTYSISYMSYDWRLNEFQQIDPEASIWDGQSLQRLTPSQLLFRGQYEIKIFNNLYTQTAFYDDQGSRVEDNKRSTYYTGAVNLLYGAGSNVNLGLDLFIRSVYLDPMAGSPFSLFEFMGTFETSRTAVSSIAPKIKLAPFNKIPNIAIQTSVVFPIASDLEGKENGRPFLDNDAFQWWTQLFYDQLIGDRFLLYTEMGFFLRFRSESTDFLTPAKLIFNYFYSTRWTVYLLTEVGPSWDGFGWNSYYSQLGAGTKFQLLSNLEIEGLYTIFPFGKNSGAGQTFNLGFRFVF